MTCEYSDERIRRTRRAWQTPGWLGCVTLVLSVGCGDESSGAAGDAGALSDTTVVSDTNDGLGDGSATDAPIQVTVVDAVGDSAGGGGAGKGGLFTQVQIPDSDNTVFHGCWAEGSTRVFLAGTNGAVAGHDGLAWESYTAGTFPTLNAIASSNGGNRTFAVGLNGTVVQSLGADGKPGKAWGPPGACSQASDCDDNSPCTSDVCEDGVCKHLASGAAGCCGGAAFGDSFDTGSLGGWTVTDLHAAEEGAGGIVWSAAAMTAAGGQARNTSPPATLYFGRTDQACPGDATKTCPTFDNGKVVGSAALAKAIAIPVAAKATLTFQLFLDVESSTSYDKLEIGVQPKAGAKKVVWTKAALNGSGSTGGEFALQTADLSEFIGQTVQIEVKFDTVDSYGNGTEGVYIDDLLLSTTCGADVGSAESLTDRPFFAVWAANDDDAWAVGAEGAIAHWNGAKWLMKTSEPRDVYDISGVPGGQAFAVGQKGLLGELGAGGLGVEQVPTAVDLRSVAITAASGDKPAHAIAVGDQGVTLQWDGKTWSVADAFTPEPLAAVTAVGDGSYFAVTGTTGLAKIFARDTAGTWALKSIASGTIADVAALPSGKAFAVGKAGLLLTRQGDNWMQSKAFGAFDAYALHLTDDNDGWAVGSAGLVSHWNGTTWEVTPAGTGKTLRAVWASAADDVWAVGLLGTAIHYDGQAWTAAELPGDKAGLDLFAVWGRSAKEIYAAGVGGVVLRWDGVAWQSISEPVTATLRALWGSKPSDIWAVGAEAAIYHYGGGAWAPVAIEPYPIPGQDEPYVVESTLYAVWGSGPVDVWAAGAPDKNGAGVLVHWDGKAWTYVPALQDESRTVRSLWGWQKNQMLIGGTAGMLYNFDGGEVTSIDAGSIATFFGICPYGKDALLVGSMGTVLRFTPID